MRSAAFAALRLLLVVACVAPAALHAADGTVFSADFADGKIPAGISDNTYQGTVPAIGVVAAGDAKAMQIAVAEGGFAQVQLGEFAMARGATYRAQATVAATPDAAVRLFFRRRGAPYTTYMVSEFTASATPVAVVVEGVMPEDCPEATLMLYTASRAVVRVGALTITRSGGVAGDGTLRDGGFEGAFAPVAPGTSPKATIEGEIGGGWQDDSGWGDVSLLYARETDGAQAGHAAQRVQVRAIGQGGGAQFCQKVRLTAGRVYRVGAWLRSASNNRALIQLREVGAPYTTWAKTIAGLSPEWRHFTFLARMPADSDTLLMFNPEDPGTYWVDDVTLEDVTDQLKSSGPVRSGNQWDSGSFEAGAVNGWSVAVGGFDDEVRAVANEARDLQARSDVSSPAADGAGSLAVDLPPWTAGMLTSPLTTVTLGRTCTASIALRSDHLRSIGLALLGTDAQVEVEIGPEWRRFAVTGTALLGTEVRLRVRCVNRDEVPATMWFDGAMLEDGDRASAAYLRPYPVELGLSVPRPGGIVVDGEAAPITVRAVGYAALPAGAQLVCSVENLAGVVTKLPPVKLPATTFTVAPDPAAPRGVFKLRAQVVDAAGTALSATAERLFARLPPPRALSAELDRASYFGAHVEPNADKLAIAKATGARWIRLHDTSRATLWPAIEAVRGTRVWHDDGVRAARAVGLHVLGMLGGAPPWASRAPQAEHGYFSMWSVPDADGADAAWSAYVAATVTHYQPLIDTWEVWNEPWVNGPRDTFFPNGTPEQYAALLRSAAAAARAADPAVTLVGVCTSTGDPAWVQRVLAAAGPEHFDALSFHYYGSRLMGGQPTPMARIAEMFNTAQSARGTAKPLWDSEGGISDNASWYRQPAAALHFQMASQVRLDVAQLAAGVRRFFPYTMHGTTPQGQEEHALLEYDRTPKSSLAARAVLASEVDGAVYAGRTEPLANDAGVEAHAFRHADGSVVRVVWSNDNRVHTLPLAGGQAPLDVLGNPLRGTSVELGDAPIYLHGR